MPATLHSQESVRVRSLNRPVNYPSECGAIGLQQRDSTSSSSLAPWTPSLTGIRLTSLIWIITSRVMCGAKPALSTLNSYWLGGNKEKQYKPSGSVTAVRSWPVPLCKVIIAFGTTAPLGR